jgi:hypothetical protein
LPQTISAFSTYDKLIGLGAEIVFAPCEILEGRHTMTVTNKIQKITLRILAVFSASGLSVIGAGALAGVELWQAILMAGVGGVATVVEGLSRAYINDGDLSDSEIDEVFNSVDTKSKGKKSESV